RRRAAKGAGEAEHGEGAAASRVPDQPGDIPNLGPDPRRGWEIPLERKRLVISGHALEEWAQQRAILLGVRLCEGRMTRVPSLSRLAPDALVRASRQILAEGLVETGRVRIAAKAVPHVCARAAPARMEENRPVTFQLLFQRIGSHRAPPAGTGDSGSDAVLRRC